MIRNLACRRGVDLGGTFSDLVLFTRDARIVTRKVLSTSGNYAEAIIAGRMRELLRQAVVSGDSVAALIHGTTVATNAMIAFGQQRSRQIPRRARARLGGTGGREDPTARDPTRVAYSAEHNLSAKYARRVYRSRSRFRNRRTAEPDAAKPFVPAGGR